MPSSRTLALAASVRMVHRVHGHTAHSGSAPEPARTSRLAQANVFVINISHLADGGLALQQYSPQFSLGQLQQGITTLLGHELHSSAGATRQLPALSCFHFHIVDDGTQGNFF
jgi:hypothetical protein